MGRASAVCMDMHTVGMLHLGRPGPYKPANLVMELMEPAGAQLVHDSTCTQHLELAGWLCRQPYCVMCARLRFRRQPGVWRRGLSEKLHVSLRHVIDLGECITNSDPTFIQQRNNSSNNIHTCMHSVHPTGSKKRVRQQCTTSNTARTRRHQLHSK